ncbi:hypothetical protein [Micromonospora globbae]|uniref:Uncharacterized protein n=1 Tax=Micromonospora globbae TaxID=1894969 RepID=A0ABZ1RZ52_9ACTN|nr:hypothetical protein [Micromonospora globbae]WTF87873.1 hypothetical protein OH732_10040 [Micromonospora globbae]
MTTEAHFLGDADAPPPPPGHGVLVVTFHFTSKVELYRSGMLLRDRPNWDIWVPPPVLTVDGQPVRASWSTWCYPLPAGPHQVDVREPAAAGRRVEVVAGEAHRLRYDASVTIRKDHTDTRVLQWHGTGRWRA